MESPRINCAANTDNLCPPSDPDYPFMPAPVLSGVIGPHGRPWLTWTEVPYAEEYELYVTSSIDNTWRLIYAGPDLLFEDTHAIAGITYTYKVRALNAATFSDFSNLVTLLVPIGIPILSGMLRNNADAYLSWTSVPDATAYMLYRKRVQDDDYVLLYEGSDLNFEDTTIEAGTVYYYYVVAENPYIIGAKSNIVILSPRLTAPVLTGALATNGMDIVLNWNFVQYATSYTLYRRINNTENYEVLYSGNNISYVDTDTYLENVYTYYVTANGGAGSSPRSNLVSLTPEVNTPVISGFITSDSSSILHGNIILDYNDYPADVEFEVYRSTNDGDYLDMGSTTGGDNYIDVIVIGNIYKYYVVASDPDGRYTSPQSNIVTLDANIPAPVLTGYADTTNGMDGRLSWTPVTSFGAVSYQLYRSTDQTNYTQIYSGQNVSYVDETTISNITYYYYVVAMVGAASSNRSNIVSLTATNKPAILAATGSQVSWNTWNYTLTPNFGIFPAGTTFELYRSTSSSTGPWSSLGMITSAYVDSIPCPQTYYYFFNAYNPRFQPTGYIKCATVACSARYYTFTFSPSLFKTRYPTATFTASCYDYYGAYASYTDTYGTGYLPFNPATSDGVKFVELDYVFTQDTTLIYTPGGSNNLMGVISSANIPYVVSKIDIYPINVAGMLKVNINNAVAETTGNANVSVTGVKEIGVSLAVLILPDPETSICTVGAGTRVHITVNLYGS